MIQEFIVYILLAFASAYVVYRVYKSIKKKQACDKCGLMEAAKKAQAGK
ncbi:MAG: FeoB-associated Cys-rich membrane protein [Bacteroidia bacterium]